MRFRFLASLVILANCNAADEAAFEFTAQQEILTPPPAKGSETLFGAKFEPTRREVRETASLTSDKWEQGFLLHARLPLDEALTLRHDLRTGVETETALGPALAATYRDALTLLEKTSTELRASDALTIAGSFQRQWLANNQVPFAEIVTYGTEVLAKPLQGITLKLQADWQEREEFAGRVAAQQTYRFRVEEEFIANKLRASVGATLVDSAELSGREIVERKWDASLFWSPDGERTALTLGVDLAERELTYPALFDSASEVDRVANYRLKIRQRSLAGNQVELHAGRESHPSGSSAVLASASAWHLGANSEFPLHEDWNATLGMRYLLRDVAPALTPQDEFSLTLSLKGRF